MDTVKRLKEFLKEKNVSKSEFYKRTGISNGYLDKVKSIGADKIEIILNNYEDLNLYWLINGKGDSVLEPNEYDMVNTPNYYPFAAVRDNQLVTEKFRPSLVDREKDEMRHLRLRITQLEDRVDELRENNKILRQFLKEKDERMKEKDEKIKQLMEKIEG